MAKLELNSQQRSRLKAAAHPLRPVVIIGSRGLADSVLAEIDSNLSAHELIKVKASGQDRSSREEWLHHICETLACAPVHHIGNTFILFRPKPIVNEQTRAIRKPSQPHTPKKLAAEGLRRTRRGRTVKDKRAGIQRTLLSKRPKS